MHITSLPGPYGLGTMGRSAREFVDFLKKAGQSVWQILPLTPTGYGDSPYQSCSAYAGNHYLIDLEELVQDGLLERKELQSVKWCRSDDRADFGLLYRSRLKMLRKAYSRFTLTQDFRNFCREQAAWLPDFSLYMALKDDHQGKPWYRWEKPLRSRDPDALWQARQRLKPQVHFYNFVQYLFYRQWERLHRYAAKNGIRIIGDVPIYVPLDSCDVWSNPELFQLEKDLTPSAVAGCPPDGFTPDGQLWGNPLYRWDAHKKDGYGWWLRRLRAASRLYDTVRLDHFRGFESYWSVPYGEKTAVNGQWVKGPGMDFIRTVLEKIPGISLIAEDLGFLTPEVLQLRDESGLPGMKVLEFAFDSREPSEYLPYKYPNNCVCYTGTHDNMTMAQWFREASSDAVSYATEFMALTEREGLVWGTIRTAMASPADLCVVQMQDYLNLGAEARMNFPGTMSSDNWTWRARRVCLTDSLAERISRLTALYGRQNKQFHSGKEPQSKGE